MSRIIEILVLVASFVLLEATAIADNSDACKNLKPTQILTKDIEGDTLCLNNQFLGLSVSNIKAFQKMNVFDPVKKRIGKDGKVIFEPYKMRIEGLTLENWIIKQQNDLIKETEMWKKDYPSIARAGMLNGRYNALNSLSQMYGEIKIDKGLNTVSNGYQFSSSWATISHKFAEQVFSTGQFNKKNFVEIWTAVSLIYAKSSPAILKSFNEYKGARFYHIIDILKFSTSISVYIAKISRDPKVRLKMTEVIFDQTKRNRVLAKNKKLANSLEEMLYQIVKDVSNSPKRKVVMSKNKHEPMSWMKVKK